MSKVSLRWVEEKVFVGTDSNSHSMVIGRSAEGDHPWQGMKPSDLLLLAVASCAAFDVVEILEKQREPLVDLRVECSGEQMLEAPYSFVTIHNHYIVVGQVNPQKLEKAIHLSETKYCSVINSLGTHVAVSSDFEILA
jgi:putative redox protein